MKKIGLWFLYFVLFVLFFVIFAPKKFLYYKLEHELQRDDIVISGEHIDEYPLWLRLQEGTLFAKSVDIGSFERVTIYPDILFNLVHIENFRSSIAIGPKLRIEKLDLFYTPFYPLKAFITGRSSLGAIKGTIDLKARRGFIDLFTNQSVSFMKRIEKGHYRYEFGY